MRGWTITSVCLLLTVASARGVTIEDLGGTQSSGAIGVTRTVQGDLASGITIRVGVENRSAQPAQLGTMKIVEMNRAWSVGRSDAMPGLVYVAGGSTLTCEPCGGAERQVEAIGVLELADPVQRKSIIVGFLAARMARPEIIATVGAGGMKTLLVQQRMNGRTLATGQKLDLDPVYLREGSDPWETLEAYGKVVAEHTGRVRTGVTSLWCSWYAHRMDVSEDLVLANAEVAAKHFKPLGFEIMQIDHGWQRQNVTGDWEPNERFGHGLKWLSEELAKRYGLKLGLWIAPTDVAETSATFKNHADWMLKGGDGKPAVNWKWYWKPNPNCYELDASRPDAAKWMEDVFRSLTAQGVSYYKIDFIAASGSEQFVQANPSETRGWGVMKCAMDAIRKGAGEDAWIRYCQTPPVLSAGLANSAYGGDDTYDAGTPATLGSLRGNARSLAAGWWINDRLYHREVCDMSVRMQADVEEARLRLAIMSLAGCSISFSDELCHLPMSRIRMMQQCLPPGAPAMRPVDLFERSIPSVWHLHCVRGEQAWEIVGLFNWEDQAQEREVELEKLGLKGDQLAQEFWEQKFLGAVRGKLKLNLAPHTSRIIALRAMAKHPQVIGTDMHVLQGYHELESVKWDQSTRTLSGRVKRMKGVEGKLMIYVPSEYTPHFDFPLKETSAHLTNIGGGVWAKEISFDQATEDFSVKFDG